MTAPDFSTLQVELRKFAAERNWERFHNPKNLAMALAVEASELLELFQWLDDEESVSSLEMTSFVESVGDELADIIIYAARLADVAGVDLTAAIPAKMAKNAKKHPAP